jgi:hypothetical protein
MPKIKPLFNRGDIARYKNATFHFLILATPEHCQHHGAPAYMGLTTGDGTIQFYTQTYLENGDWFALPKLQADDIRHRFYPSENIKVPEENRRRDASTFRFAQDSQVRHRKTGGVYAILITPDVGRLESSNTPAYSYQDVQGGPVWHRCQVEMEDGRFEEVV